MDTNGHTFEHETVCGGCTFAECPDFDGATSLLCCELCPAAYHFPCAGYYDEADGPQEGEPWYCWRCAGNLPGGLATNWVRPRGPARLQAGQQLYIAAEQPDDVTYDIFYKALILQRTDTTVKVKWENFTKEQNNVEVVPLSAGRIWHGTLASDAWADAGGYAFSPNSRTLAPDTFAEMAADAARRTRGRNSAAAAGPLQSPPKLDRSDARAVERCMQLQSDADEWLEKAHAFGAAHGMRSLAALPEFLSMRKDIFVHPFALWQVVMSWGGERKVTEKKLWSMVATTFCAPSTMTNRSVKMKQLWEEHGLGALAAAGAASSGIRPPAVRRDLLASRSKHDLVQHWPGCLQWSGPSSSGAPSTVAVGEKRPRGRPRIHPIKPKTGRGRGRPPGSGRGRASEPLRRSKRRRMTFTNRHSDSEFWDTDDEIDNAAGQSSPNSDAPAAGPAQSESAHTSGELHIQADVSIPRLPASALPPKRGHDANLPAGAISTDYTSGLRFGRHMIRLDAPVLHTTLVPRTPALELMRDAQRRPCGRPRVQFMSTEPGYLGGWWDARLEGGKTGSLLEGRMKFLVSERYPDDANDPEPRTWLPLVHYGPPAYPLQTPQVMIRRWHPWPAKCSIRRLSAGDVVEVIDPVERPDDETVRWVASVHAVHAEDEKVTVRIQVAPYGDGDACAGSQGARNDNFQLHDVQNVHRAPADDLLGMVREPEWPDARPAVHDPVAVASTNNIEEHVLVPTVLHITRAGTAWAEVRTHSTFKTCAMTQPPAQREARGSQAAALRAHMRRSCGAGAIDQQPAEEAAGASPRRESAEVNVTDNETEALAATAGGSGDDGAIPSAAPSVAAAGEPAGEYRGGRCAVSAGVARRDAEVHEAPERGVSIGGVKAYAVPKGGALGPGRALTVLTEEELAHRRACTRASAARVRLPRLTR